jgi:hypothetical protein
MHRSLLLDADDRFVSGKLGRQMQILDAPSNRRSGRLGRLSLACLAGARTVGRGRVHILQVAGSDVDWQKLVAAAVALRWALRLRDALTYLTAALEAPVPEAALRELGATP